MPSEFEPADQAWLHSRCWEAWHAARKRKAAAALRLWRWNPTGNGMKGRRDMGKGAAESFTINPLSVWTFGTRGPPEWRKNHLFDETSGLAVSLLSPTQEHINDLRPPGERYK